MPDINRILIIKHSALGDMALAFGPMQAIRAAHPDAHITLLTIKAFEGLTRASGLFDEVWCDNRPKLYKFWDVLALRRRLRAGSFGRIYDLQTSNRTAWYFHLFWPGPTPEWSGTVKGCSHPHRDPARPAMHVVEMQSGQLADAGIPAAPLSDLSWWDADISHLNLPGRYAVLLPGGAAHRPEKRWPAEHFAAIAQRLVDIGITPVIVGGPPEAREAAIVQTASQSALSLIGQTGLLDLAPIMRGASVVVGNDTGPVHVAALVGAPVTVMFGSASSPRQSRPRSHPGSPEPRVLQAQNLADLPVETVWNEVSDILR
jgi:ADP-heptose:LPS heptosyltransferase